MESIIETLYINLSRPQTPDDPELEKTKEEYFKMCDILQAQYGPDFWTALPPCASGLTAQAGRPNFPWASAPAPA